MHPLLTALKQFCTGYAKPTPKSCPHCGGGRCMGACGSSFANLVQIRIEGTVRLSTPTQGVVQSLGKNDGEEDKASSVLTFDATTRWGRMIFKKCPPGSTCRIHALVKDQHLEKLISVEKI